MPPKQQACVACLLSVPVFMLVLGLSRVLAAGLEVVGRRSLDPAAAVPLQPGSAEAA